MDASSEWMDISVARGFPPRSVGSKPQGELPSLEQENQERKPNNIQLGKAAGFPSAGERWLEVQRAS